MQYLGNYNKCCGHNAVECNATIMFFRSLEQDVVVYVTCYVQIFPTIGPYFQSSLKQIMKRVW